MKGNPADDGDPPHSATANTTATAEVASADVSIDSDPVVADAVVNLAAAGSFAVIQNGNDGIVTPAATGQASRVHESGHQHPNSSLLSRSSTLEWDNHSNSTDWNGIADVEDDVEEDNCDDFEEDVMENISEHVKEEITLWKSGKRNSSQMSESTDDENDTDDEDGPPKKKPKLAGPACTRSAPRPRPQPPGPPPPSLLAPLVSGEHPTLARAYEECEARQRIFAGQCSYVGKLDDHASASQYWESSPVASPWIGLDEGTGSSSSHSPPSVPPSSPSATSDTDTITPNANTSILTDSGDTEPPSTQTRRLQENSDTSPSSASDNSEQPSPPSRRLPETPREVNDSLLRSVAHNEAELVRIKAAQQEQSDPQSMRDLAKEELGYNAHLKQLLKALDRLSNILKLDDDGELSSSDRNEALADWQQGTHAQNEIIMEEFRKEYRQKFHESYPASPIHGLPSGHSSQRSNSPASAVHDASPEDSSNSSVTTMVIIEEIQAIAELAESELADANDGLRQQLSALAMSTLRQRRDGLLASLNSHNDLLGELAIIWSRDDSEARALDDPERLANLRALNRGSR